MFQIITIFERFVYLYGIVSWGDGCADGDFPGIYVSVPSQTKWIRDTIDANAASSGVGGYQAPHTDADINKSAAGCSHNYNNATLVEAYLIEKNTDINGVLYGNFSGDLSAYVANETTGALNAAASGFTMVNSCTDAFSAQPDCGTTSPQTTAVPETLETASEAGPTFPPITAAPGWPIIPIFAGLPGARPDPISITPPNPENIIEVVQQMVLSIFEAYGIPGITFIAGIFNNNSRKRRQLGGADDALSAVQNYGCWCSKPFTGDAMKGKSLDEIDSVCKAYSMCTRCSKLNRCVGSDDDAYSLTFVPATDNYTCVSATECGLNKCECTGQLGISLARSLIDNNFQLDANHNNVDEVECQRGGGTAFNDACCGAVPLWKPYNTLTHQCDINGNIV